MDQPLVSVITPARDASSFIKEAIESVISQEYQNWELLVVDNGSTDDTADKVRSFSDPRIVLLEEKRISVSYARNCGLAHARGEFFCFLDADDMFTPQSLSSRVSVFVRRPDAAFVDGQVSFENHDFTETLKMFVPKFEGSGVQSELLKLNGSCFMGLSWMFRKSTAITYEFDTLATFAEDLLYCLKISGQGAYYFVNEPIYRYRQHEDSLMRNLKGLEGGYRYVAKWVKNSMTDSSSEAFARKTKKTMVKSYLKRGQIWAAFKLYFSTFP